MLIISYELTGKVNKLKLRYRSAVNPKGIQERTSRRERDCLVRNGKVCDHRAVLFVDNEGITVTVNLVRCVAMSRNVLVLQICIEGIDWAI